ncbi:MAG TPA: DPP IV N-terminal domain-containing protein, partial [Actinomycetota bacterium]|nr:DPP IV N-terminal domain-containing protein [Actinomycetota bacterium]
MSDRRDSFPRQAARTRNFTLGLPRTFTVAPDGSRVVFLRSAGGEDPVTGLWVFDVEDRRERLVADPKEIGAADADLPAEERARRERAREHAEGVVGYSTDRDVTVATFVLGGALHVANLVRGEVRALRAAEPVFDPRVDPTGRRIGYVSGRALRVIGVDGEGDRALAGEDAPTVSWGMAEFVAAEEMERHRGFWWSPDGERIAAARVDEFPVQVWHISDPTNPDAEPASVRYPVAGTANAEVSLHILGLDGSRTDVRWDRAGFEYLARVVWTEGAPLTIEVQSRDQRTLQVQEVGDDGSTSIVREDRDGAWVDLVPGSPKRLADGRLVRTADSEDARRLFVGDAAVTLPTLQVRDILATNDDVLFTASEEPEAVHVWRWTPDGKVSRLTEEPGVHTAAAGGDVVVVASSTLERAPEATVWKGSE